MHIQCQLVILILVLTLDDQIYTGAVIGGHEAVPHSRPYMVLVERHMQDGGKTYCGGFLLNEDFVMTAANCEARSYTVLLGVQDIHKNNNIQRISVKHSFPHRDYDATDFKNDVMLLQLSTKAHFSKTVRPIALAGEVGHSLPKSCMFSGWGRTDSNKKHMSPKLMEANVTLIDSVHCAGKNVYCSEGDPGPGPGDAGGPLVCEDGKAYGVMSAMLKPDPSTSIYSFTKIPDSGSYIICNP